MPSACHRLGAALCAAAIVGTCTGRVDSPKPAYAFEADGSPAAVGRAVEVVATDDPPISLISSGVVCGERIFLADPRLGVVHEVRLDDGIRSRVLTGPDVGTPESIAADCTRRQLMVSHQHGVSVLEMDSGRRSAHLPKPEAVGPTLGLAVVADGHLVLPGYVLGDRGAWLTAPPSQALRGAAIGYRLPLDGSAGRPLLQAGVTTTCRSMSFERLRVGVDRWQQGWVAGSCGW